VINGTVIRTVGDDHEPQQFATYDACAIACRNVARSLRPLIAVCDLMIFGLQGRE